MKHIIILLTIMLIASCTKKCEIDEDFGASTCYSSDGWTAYTGIHPITDKYFHYAYEEDFIFEDVCEGQTIESGSCDVYDY